jgi:hypothetical protein
MTILGKLNGERPEPMDEASIAAVETRLRGLWTSPATIDRRELESLVAQIRWQERRLLQVESLIAGFLDAFGLWR